ncbi:MAG: DUF4198 domain-containing protein [Pseudomonadota bacterium]
MSRMLRLAKAAITLSCAALAPFAIGGPVSAHEFWVSPEAYEVAVGETIEASLRNGDMFKGAAYPYIGAFATRFDVHNRRGTEMIRPRDGDNPALTYDAESGGLHVVAYDSAMYSLTYASWEKFQAFIDSKPNLAFVYDEHEAKGFPREGIKEGYYRYPKSLIKVGSGAGRDKPLGRVFELVAEINPYSEAAKTGVRVQLLYEGAPFPNTDIQIFHRPGDGTEVAKDHVTTDATGRATIPVFDGGEFLINATHMRKPRPEAAAQGMHWESIWASLTYELPRIAE